ncbi:FUSC family membrane protein [Thermophagus sp. OGC60D27]|uniref:FUSC family membrane protein n=1 Tax=Thermophagus sp. OGC60D27 TaxID=3458415 RepID=UPI0040377692
MVIRRRKTVMGKVRLSGRWMRAFLLHPDWMMAAKATMVMGIVILPLEILGYSFFAVTAALGVLAGALSETDDHPRGRIQSLALKVVGFGISSLSVELLRPWPLLLGGGLGLSTIVFILTGGIGERYRGITFGAILVGLYAMIGSEISPAWYWQPLLLPGGALFYGLISLGFLYLRPYRLLDEHLGRGYMALSRYLDEKSHLFPSDKRNQREVRAKLALLNVEMVNTLDRIKDVLNSYRDAMDDESELAPWFHYFMVLQALHERAASSHERYDLLSNDPATRELVELAGHTLHELAHASGLFAEALLAGSHYRRPSSLNWIIQTLLDRVEKLDLDSNHPLRLLVANLEQANASFSRLAEVPDVPVLPKLLRDDRPLWKKFSEQLSFRHPRMRYALRLAICFWIGFLISEVADIEKGEWIILTVLFVLQPSYSATRRRLFQRVLGTLTGVIVGILIVQLLTMPGQVLLMLASAFFFFVWLKKEYSVSVVFITTFVLCAFNLISNIGVAMMVPRLADTLIGAVLALGSVRLLWHQWQYKKLPVLLDDALTRNRNYLEAILAEYEHPNSMDDLEYRIARREAHQADNALAMAWQDIQTEPEKYKSFHRKAFKMTYLNHALLSFISAFGAHRGRAIDVAEGIIDTGRDILKILGDKNLSPVIRQAQMESVVRDLQQRLKQEAPTVNQQQLILLYNIADIGHRLVRETVAGQSSPNIRE